MMVTVRIRLVDDVEHAIGATPGAVSAGKVASGLSEPVRILG
jgi:hypothetical protein